MIYQEEPRRFTREELEQEHLYRLVCVEWLTGELELRAIDDRDDAAINLKNYNKVYRVWSNVPTDEQRKITPWIADEVNE